MHHISLIRSRLEYCAAVWDPYLIKDINTLEGIQRCAARFVIQDHSRFTSVSSLLKDLNCASHKDRRRDIRLAMLFKIVKCNMPVQADNILLPADPRTRHHHSFKYKHIQSHTTQYKHSFLSEQYLSGTLFLKPVSTRIPSLHSSRSSIMRPERCAHPPSS